MPDRLVALFTYIGVGVVVGAIAGVVVQVLWDPSPWITGAMVGPVAAIAGVITSRALENSSTPTLG